MERFKLLFVAVGLASPAGACPTAEDLRSVIVTDWDVRAMQGKAQRTSGGHRADAQIGRELVQLLLNSAQTRTEVNTTWERQEAVTLHSPDALERGHWPLSTR